MKVGGTFESDFNAKILDELGYRESYYYPGASMEGGRDGLIVEVNAGGKNWTGVFAHGEVSPKGVSCVYNMPDPDKLCVVSRGAGYIVSSINPEDWHEVQVKPIMDVRASVSENILVFADYTGLTAYDEKGIKWRTARLCYDGLKIIGISGDVLKGEFWSMRNESNETFEIDLSTGLQISGIKEI